MYPVVAGFPFPLWYSLSSTATDLYHTTPTLTLWWQLPLQYPPPYIINGKRVISSSNRFNFRFPATRQREMTDSVLAMCPWSLVSSIPSVHRMLHWTFRLWIPDFSRIEHPLEFCRNGHDHRSPRIDKDHFLWPQSIIIADRVHKTWMALRPSNWRPETYIEFGFKLSIISPRMVRTRIVGNRRGDKEHR